MIGLREVLTRDEEEREPDVRRLHALIRRSTARPLDYAAQSRVLTALANAQLWSFTAGACPKPERWGEIARLTGKPVRFGFRGGVSASGKRYASLATTRSRLLRTGIGRPSDDQLCLPMLMHAHTACAVGLDAITINERTAPNAYLGPDLMAAFAGRPTDDADGREEAAAARFGDRGPVRLQRTMLSDRLLETATTVARGEAAVERATLVVTMVGDDPLVMLLVVTDEGPDPRAIAQRLSDQLIRSIGPQSFVAVQCVSPGDRRLTDPDRAIVLVVR